MVTQKESTEKRRLKRDKMASYFLDLSKVLFTVMVVGGISPLLDRGTVVEAFSIIIGVSLTILCALIGYSILDN